MRYIKILLIGSLLNLSLYAKTMDIYTQVSANIISMAKVDQNIKKNDILIKLDDKQISFKIQEQRANVNLAKLFLDDAKKYYDQDVKLYDQTLISQRELDLSKIKYLEKKYIYQSKLAALNVLNEQKKLYTIKSPFNGVVKEIVNNINATNKYNPIIIMKIKSN